MVSVAPGKIETVSDRIRSDDQVVLDKIMIPDPDPVDTMEGLEVTTWVELSVRNSARSMDASKFSGKTP